MKKIIVDGLIFPYKITVNPNQKNDMYVRVKEKEYVEVTVKKKVDELEVEKVLQTRGSFLKERLPKTNRQNIIHVKDIPYIPHFIVNSFPYVQIMGNHIVIASPKTDVASYQKVLYDYYEQIIRVEIDLIINEARKTFYDINFPSITYKYYKRCFGMYDPSTHQIILSTILGKCDPFNIKQTLYHELCHVKVLDHSPRFYQYFETKMKNAREIDLKSRRATYLDCL